MDQMPVKAAQNLKGQMGDRVCMYTIRMGDDPAGTKQMERIASTGACGFPVMVVDYKTSMTMGDLVERIFLAKAEKPEPKHPVPIAKPMDSDGDGVTDDNDQCPNTPIGGTVDARGCWTYEASVLFDVNRTEIKSEAHPMLNEAYDILKKNPDISIEVNGHTDNIGTEEYNMKLSKKRANAVMEYFVRKGIDANRFTTKGFGFTKPVVSNDTKEGRAKNRRVELIPVK
jgi:OOP family OmpA-OmpF porin